MLINIFLNINFTGSIIFFENVILIAKLYSVIFIHSIRKMVLLFLTSMVALELNNRKVITTKGRKLGRESLRIVRR